MKIFTLRAESNAFDLYRWRGVVSLILFNI